MSLSRSVGTRAPRRPAEPLAAMCAHVEARLACRHSLKDLAGVAGLSQRATLTLLRAQGVAGVRGFVLDIRLRRLRLAMNSAYELRTLRRLAADLGFPSAAAMSVAYRRAFNETLATARRRSVDGSFHCVKFQ